MAGHFQLCVLGLGLFQDYDVGVPFPRVRAYALADADASCPDCFAGVSAIKATPMTLRTADPTRNPTRWLGISSPSIDIATAWAKLDHAAERKIEAKHHRIANVRICGMRQRVDQRS